MALEDGVEIPDIIVERRKNADDLDETVIDIAGLIPKGVQSDQLLDMLETQVTAQFGRRALRPPNTAIMNNRVAIHVRRQLRYLKLSGDLLKRPAGWRLAPKLRNAYLRKSSASR